MAHWDDSGTSVGYEGKKGDKLILKSLGIKPKKKKKAKAKKRVAPVRLDTKLKKDPDEVDGYIDAQQDEMDRLYDLFEVSDDVGDILAGSEGMSDF